MEVPEFLLLFLPLHPMSGLILPLTKPNGDPDMTSIISHMTLMEQTIQSLQTQAQTTNSELSTVKALLQRTEDELTAAKADLKLAEADIVGLKHDLQKSPDPVEFALLKSKVEALKVSHGVQVEITNLKSQVQGISKFINNKTTDVISAESRLAALETGYSSIISRQNTTEQDLTATKASVKSTAADVKDVKTQLNTLAGEVTGLSQAVAMKNNTKEDVAFQVKQTQANYNVQTSTATTLKFDTVDYNAGNGYDSTSGMFTAPVSGSYIFWANVLIFGEYGIKKIYVFKGTHELSKTKVKLQQVDHPYDERVASVMTVTHLEKGEQIHFTAEVSAQGPIEGSALSSYGGALLHAT